MLTRAIGFGVFVLLLLGSTNSAFGEDFESSRTYMIQVDGFRLSTEALVGKEKLVRTGTELAKFRPSKALAANPIFVELHSKVAPLLEAKTPFAIEFTTNDRGEVTSAFLLTSDGRAQITPRSVAATPAPAPAPAPAPQPSTTPPNPNHVTKMLVINRKATDAERQAANVTELSWADLLGARLEDALKHAQLQNLITAVQNARMENPELLRLRVDSNSPFTLTWKEDAAGVVVTDVTLQIAGTTLFIDVRSSVARSKPTPVPPTPGMLENFDENTQAPSSLEDIEYAIAEGAGGEALLKEVVLWAAAAPAGAVQCAVGPGGALQFTDARVAAIFVAAEIKNEKDFDSAHVAGILDKTANALQRPSRFALFQNKRGKTCLTRFFNRVWDRVLASAKPRLVADLHETLKTISKRRAELGVDTATHSFTVQDAGLKDQLDFLIELAVKLDPASIQSLPEDFRLWATTDTNSTDPDTRKEPIDILTTQIATTSFPTLPSELAFGDVGRIELVKAALQRRFMPSRFAPRILVSRTSEEQTKKAGREIYYVFCAGETITLPSSSNLTGHQTALFTSAAIDERDLIAYRTQRSQPGFSCGPLKVVLRVPEEKLSVQLRNPIDHRYSIGSDRKIKAVTTFPIVGAAGKEVVAALKLGTATQGYRYVSETKTQDFKAEFLADLADADFYIAAAHATNGASFAIGTEGSTRLVLEKKTGDSVSQLVAFVPGPTPGRQVNMSDGEIAALFRKRREMEDQRRLTVMNIACGSEACIPHWVKAYRQSLSNTQFTTAQAEALQGEVPVIIGAKRSFSTDGSAVLLSHAVHPFAALKAASNESSLKELLGALESSGFTPQSNTGTLEGFDIQTQTQKLVIVIEGQGVRVIY